VIGFPLAIAISVLLGRFVFGGYGEAAFISFLLSILAEMWAYDRYRQWRASKLLKP
jgi:hypothetical protein